MEKYEIAYIITIVALALAAATFGFMPAYAAPTNGYVQDQLQMSSYGLYYKVNQDYQHIGISVEDNGENEFAVEHFTEHAINVLWEYANFVNPQFNGVFRIAGFERYQGMVDEVFYLETPAADARMMSQADFVAQGMSYYYNEHNDFPESGDYYVSRTSYSGNGVILVDTYADLYEPQPTILVTTQADTADWNAPI